MENRVPAGQQEEGAIFPSLPPNLLSAVRRYTEGNLQWKICQCTLFMNLMQGQAEDLQPVKHTHTQMLVLDWPKLPFYRKCIESSNKGNSTLHFF